MAQLIRIRQDLIVSTDEITVAGLAFVELRDGRSFSIVPQVWNALMEIALPERGVDVTPYEERGSAAAAPMSSQAVAKAMGIANAFGVTPVEATRGRKEPGP